MQDPSNPLSHDALTVARAELMIGGSDDAFRTMLHDAFSVFAGLEHVRNRFGAFCGLSGPQYTILAAVRQLQGKSGVGVKELADHLGLSGAFVTIETKRLVAKGLLDKAVNPLDLRRVNLTLSGKGATVLLQLAPVQREINDTLFGPLSATDFARLCKMMAALRPSVVAAAADADRLLQDRKDQQ